MREKVIIFDGDNSHEIGAPYFFQHKKIRDLSKERVKEIYTSTLIYVKVLTDVKNKSIQGPIVKMVSSGETLIKAERGLSILRQMVIDMWGDKIGTAIVEPLKTKV
jgi:hypothetical protein